MRAPPRGGRSRIVDDLDCDGESAVFALAAKIEDGVLVPGAMTAERERE